MLSPFLKNIASRLDIGHHHSRSKMLRGLRKACTLVAVTSIKLAIGLTAMRMLGKGATAKRSLGGVRHRDSEYGAQGLVFDSCLLLSLVFDMTIHGCRQKIAVSQT